MDSRTRHAFLKRKYPNKVIVVAEDHVVAGEIELRTFGEDMKKLYWIDGAKRYNADKGPGLRIKKFDLTARYEIDQIAPDAWIVRL